MARTDLKSVVVAGLLLLVPGTALAEAIELQSLTLRKGELTLVVRLSPELALREPVFVGVTILKPRQSERGLDLPVQEVTAANRSKPLTFKAKLGPGFVSYAVGVWGKKVPEPGHPLGYAMQQPLGGFPDDPFGTLGELGWGDATYAPLVEHPLKIRMLDAGAGPEAVAEANKVVTAALPQGVLAQLVDGGKAQAPRKQVEVMVRDAGHYPLAETLAKKLGGSTPAPVKAWPDAPDPIVVAVGK